jgi:hypothetical protein
MHDVATLIVEGEYDSAEDWNIFSEEQVLLDEQEDAPVASLTLSTPLVFDDAAVIVTSALTTNTLLAVPLAVPDGFASPSLTRTTSEAKDAVGKDVADDSLTLAPFAVVLTDVVAVPLISADPSGTRLACADVEHDAETSADALCSRSAVTDVLDETLTVTATSNV